jgi:hypothetical protein
VLAHLAAGTGVLVNYLQHRQDCVLVERIVPEIALFCDLEHIAGREFPQIVGYLALLLPQGLADCPHAQFSLVFQEADYVHPQRGCEEFKEQVV